MLTYLDRTFCTAQECLSFPTCAQALTQEVRVRFESAGYLDDEGGTNLSETEIEYIQRLVVIR